MFSFPSCFFFFYPPSPPFPSSLFRALCSSVFLYKTIKSFSTSLPSRHCQRDFSPYPKAAVIKTFFPIISLFLARSACDLNTLAVSRSNALRVGELFLWSPEATVLRQFYAHAPYSLIRDFTQSSAMSERASVRKRERESERVSEKNAAQHIRSLDSAWENCVRQLAVGKTPQSFSPLRRCENCRARRVARTPSNVRPPSLFFISTAQRAAYLPPSLHSDAVTGPAHSGLIGASS